MYKIFETIIDNIGTNPEGQTPGITDIKEPNYLEGIYNFTGTTVILLIIIIVLLIILIRKKKD